MKAILLLLAIVMSLLLPAMFTGVRLDCGSMDPDHLLSCD